jgi:glycolate oxidase FAD binding subunit
MERYEPALQDLIERVQRAAKNSAPLEIRGGGTKSFYGGAIAGELLDVSSLQGVSSYEPTELVITARAGTPLLELEKLLQGHGQCLPFEPPRFSAGGSVGGMIAAGLSGPSRANAGSVRDHLLGVTLLNGRGDVLTFGGQVSKNVAGYDVSRLMAGALGTLGVLCEVSMKVLPVSPATATLSFECEQTRALEQFSVWSARPLPISAGCWHDGRLHLRLSGARAAVSAACDVLSGVDLGADAAAEWWRSVRDQTHRFFSLDENALRRGERLWRLSLPPNTPAIDLQGEIFIEWSGAQRWLRTAAPSSQLRQAAHHAGGHATLVRGLDKSEGVFAPLNEVLMRVHRGLKQSFDPQGIFNPGRLYPEL